MRILQKESTRLCRIEREIGKQSFLKTRTRRISKLPGRSQTLHIRDACLHEEWEKLPASRKKKILDKMQRLRKASDISEESENKGKCVYTKAERRMPGYTGSQNSQEKQESTQTQQPECGEQKKTRREKKVQREIKKETQREIRRAAVHYAASKLTGNSANYREEADRQQKQGMKQAAKPARKLTGIVMKKVAGAALSAVAALSPMGIIIIFMMLFLIILLGIFGSVQTGTAQAVGISPEVEAYRAAVTDAAARYEMSEYVELLLAVMMQESGGKGSDPMQAAEGAYNTRYPHVPNGIQDPAYSIECGVQELKTSLNLAGVTSCTDLIKIRIALQGYNFGSGYIQWMGRNNYFEWSFETACEFAEGTGWGKRADPNSAAGPWKYGDQHYPEHVLQYYSLNGSASVPAGGLPIPIYHQYDYQQAYGSGTIAQYGCGPTSFAMVVSYLKNEVITPADVVAWCGNRYYVPGQGTSWDFYSAAAAHYGIGSVTSTNSAASVLQALKEGKPVISSQSPGLFTRGGHYIVLRGVTETGKVLVNDPNDNDSKNYQQREFDLQKEIHSTSKCYWIFETKK